MQQWWHQDIESVVKHFSSDLDRGLTEQQVGQQHARVGLNELTQKEAHSPLKLFVQQFKGFVIWVLIGAAVVSALVGEGIDAGIIGAIVVLNAILGFVQEFRAEKSLAAHKKQASPNSQVLRGGNHQEVPSAQLVPGDVIELEAGDNVPADCRITWVSSGFAVQEASLTGESLAVTKDVEPLDQEVPLADRINMIFMGTSITNGRAKAIVVETGMSTELGKIADMMADIEDEMTPLQRKLEQFGKGIVVVCLILVSLIFVMGLLHGGELKEIFLTAVSLAVAAIPEGLPAVVTIALALGVQRMVKRNGLIRKLPSVETLGCTTVICSDKTGTLTRNEMTVQRVYAGQQWFDVSGSGYAPKGEFTLAGASLSVQDQPDLVMALKTGVLCNGARLVEEEEGYGIIGDPTEGCLLTAGAKANLTRESLESDNPVVDEVPFDSERRKMSVVCRSDGKLVAYVKGAPDEVLKDCTHIQEAGQVKPLTDQVKATLMDANSELADQAMRVLAGAYRVLDEGLTEFEVETVEKELIFVGLFGLMDPPREEVKLAIKECASAGIRPVMITGDHKKTAVAIAKKLAFFGPESLALSGAEVDQLSDDALRDKVEQIAVYARVSPEHKLRIVRAWRDRGQIVAMTGDGVNDAPALKEADIGVAMGITGTDVTKEVADMVITDDNYTSIVAAVEEGRGVYDNICKFVHYLLSCNAGEIMLMFVSSLLGWKAPLLAVHILWINLVTDGLPALALGVERIDPDLMTRPPRPVNEPVVTRAGGLVMLGQAALMAACALGAYAFVWHQSGGPSDDPETLRKARTVAFIVLACSQLFHSFNCRNLKESLFKIGPFGNMKLVAAVSISFLVQVAVVHVPLLQGWFRTQPLTVSEWGWVLLVSSIPLWGVELAKAVTKQMRKA